MSRLHSFIVNFSAISAIGIFATSAMAESAQGPNDPVTRAQLPALIKEILIKDPNILTEVVQKMQENQEAQMMAKGKEDVIKHKDKIYNDPAAPMVGPANADVTVVEFFDYHCGYCKQALSSLITLMEKDKKVRVLFKEYPILSEDSKLASLGAIAVNRIAKDKYFDFHKAMFNVGGTISEKTIIAEAKKLGIDEDRMKKELSNPEVEATLTRNKELGAAIGAVGTPAIIIGDNFYPGAMPYEAMQKAVDDVRAANAKADKKS